MSSPRKYPWFYRPLEWLLLGLAHLPFSVLYLLADGIYLLLAYVIRYRERVVLENLRNSFPEKAEAEIRQIARKFYRHFAEVMVETLKLAVLTPAELKRRVLFRNPEVMERWFAQGRAVLGLSSHAGNWEWVLTSGAAWLSAQADGVYKPLSNPFFEDFMYRLRTRTGAGLIPMRETLRNLLRHRGQPRVVSLLSDQAAGPEDQPYWTNFLHQDSGFYTSADRLAPQFHFPVIYVSIRRQRRGYYEIVLTELYNGDAPLEPGKFAITESFVRHLEHDIRLFPSDYLWTHRRWKHKR
ncbi:KDO2-lipid IV(A) lauroyltransferase [Hymenobacter daecheongensis DSM 21074]|uniref:KDO2-lipid IV(A) lauroyltransferase n=1 Tax=Hymenobacter daecheongensis DSM 21074 TaxID=1121955 RepID=A0A1M6G8A6_9BACT|nr:lysophospholipid acyltransferase family protein [Hymenobacter daecheongensis]SHJ06144.1 KDO2-lipid IV(A) lauroyltransferase [Hymenobacter daecheongensis DSM 21074]